MKTFIKYNLLLLTLIVSSCSNFLEQEPQTALTEEQVFSELDNIEPLVLGLYTSWRNTRKDRGGFVFLLGTDEAQQGAYQVLTDASQAGLDRYNGFLSPSNNALAEQWDSRWPVIAAAARVISSLQFNEQDPERKNFLLGEASFIRAALTFEMVQYWGDVPIIDVDRFDELGTARQPQEAVYAYIIQDLENAIAYLPISQNDKRRATKGVAEALLGKVYLYAPEETGVRSYEKALEHFEAVVNSGTYSLVADYAELWDPAHSNTSESLYEFQFSNVVPDNNQCQWQMGSRAVALVDQYAYFGGYDLLVPTSYAYQDNSEGGIWEEGDLRKEESIRYDFTYRGVPTPLQPGWGGDELDPHVKKYEDPRTDGTLSFWNSGKNIFYLRYADVLLCYAEVLNELGQTAEAVKIVNTTVRQRAWGGTLPASAQWNAGMSQAEFRTNILDERMRELCFEGWRRMDLNRTTTLTSYVPARNRWAQQSNTIQSYHRYYPIPLQEIRQNEDISEDDQNPGYANQ
ncbi:RagB/SusD family nutrient uptake outer membrane protein [Olivibacter sp. SDN3]|uniref:RagB/SusD family nutrient uptake outer membrane protein n=1 Tax=Olivibacter sp. SDN3 TaxID=2764720 RepID=UPI00165189DB|nr:RagB/SusD family nutrient uptake outer membrane protein [Olivibacter sp. SDN3]QNL49557.1 RagB/SusD family nutrient uptake outer membrane protein [Olivibacter sp. SDN3]